MGTSSADQPPTVHPTAVVHPSASLGAGTVVWSHVCVGEHAVIGRACRIGHAAYIDRTVRLGDRVWVHSKASIYRPVEIGDDVFVGPHVVFVNDPDPDPAAARELTGVSWKVGQAAVIGANVTVLSDIDLAPHCFIGAGAVVTHPTVPYGVYVGVPARLTGYRCACRQRYPAEPGLPPRCQRCQRVF